jgi:hypothetical protein
LFFNVDEDSSFGNEVPFCSKEFLIVSEFCLEKLYLYLEGQFLVVGVKLYKLGALYIEERGRNTLAGHYIHAGGRAAHFWFDWSLI